LKKQSSKQ